MSNPIEIAKVALKIAATGIALWRMGVAVIDGGYISWSATLLPFPIAGVVIAAIWVA